MASWINNNEACVIYLRSNIYASRYRYGVKHSIYSDKEKLLLLNKPWYTSSVLVMLLVMRLFFYLYCHFRSASVCYLIDISINDYYIMKICASTEYYKKITDSG